MEDSFLKQSGRSVGTAVSMLCCVCVIAKALGTAGSEHFSYVGSTIGIVAGLLITYLCRKR